GTILRSRTCQGSARWASSWAVTASSWSSSSACIAPEVNSRDPRKGKARALAHGVSTSNTPRGTRCARAEARATMARRRVPAEQGADAEEGLNPENPGGHGSWRVGEPGTFRPRNLAGPPQRSEGDPATQPGDQQRDEERRRRGDQHRPPHHPEGEHFTHGVSG